MLNRGQFLTVTVVAAVCVLSASTNIVIYSQNRGTQAQVAERAQYIQQSVQLQSLYQEIVKALADLSVRKQDKSLADLLARQGITVTVNTPAAATSSGADSATAAPVEGKRGSRR